jgi:epoxyqueuosine reductase
MLESHPCSQVKPMNHTVKGKHPEIKIKKLKRPAYILNSSKLRRFSNKKTVFNRVTNDPSWKGYMRMYDENVPHIIKQGKIGYSRVDFALADASSIVYDAFDGAFSHSKIKLCRPRSCSVGIDWTKTKHEADSPQKTSSILKQAATVFGASLTGICKLDRRWLYTEAEVPRRLENVVVMAVEMDPRGIAASPAVPAAVATGMGYSKMAFTLSLTGQFIRNLGYTAIQCGNDTALSIPIAIDAGLGELGRNGLLITPQYGPRVRLCKIFTDLPLAPDKPITLGVKEFCKKCKACAKNCKTGAISSDDEPSFDTACRSNNAGALKWYVNTELCYQFWRENGTDCSTCIKVCPYNAAPT